MPYVPLSLGAVEEVEGPIADVVVGPAPHPQLAADATRQFLRNAGYERARDMVRHSAIPLRV